MYLKAIEELGEEEGDAVALQRAERIIRANVRQELGLPKLEFGKSIDIAALARAHRGVALGVCGVARALSPRVALGGHLGQFLHVDDRAVSRALTWPWWSPPPLLQRSSPSASPLP